MHLAVGISYFLLVGVADNRKTNSIPYKSHTCFGLLPTAKCKGGLVDLEENEADSHDRDTDVCEKDGQPRYVAIFMNMRADSHVAAYSTNTNTSHRYVYIYVLALSLSLSLDTYMNMYM